MTRAEAIATTKAALRSVARGLVRAAVYLGPLLFAALGYLAKLCADAVSAGRTLLLRRAREKTPSQSPEYELQEAALRQMVDSGRRRLRRKDPADRHRQDLESRTAPAVQGLPLWCRVVVS